MKMRHTLLIDDGKVRLRLLSVKDYYADAIVVVGGEIKDRKGVNLPDTLLPMPAMTPKDRSDLDAALNLGVDWIALSFVQRPDDVAELKKVVAGRAGVLAKIEKPKALDSLQGILEMADALMVARGDLGVELPLEAVPGRQKQIIRAARKAGKPVVVATQMLESMIAAPVPTRAEVSDVATAVFDGADAVMLSAETASGAYPVEAVEMMDRIAVAVENDPLYLSILESQRNAPEETTADAIMAAVHQVTHTMHARAVVCWTKSGSTAPARRARTAGGADRRADAAGRNRAPACAGWGLHCVTTEDAHDLDDVVDRAARIALQEGFAKPGDRIVVTAGVPLGTPGSTNLLRVAVRRPDQDRLNALPLDIARQGVDMLAGAFELGIELQRLAIELQRRGLVAVILHHGAEFIERGELARIEQDHMFERDHRTGIVACRALQIGAGVPAFGIVGRHIGHGLEQFFGRRIVAGGEGGRPARHQQVDAGAVRLQE